MPFERYARNQLPLLHSKHVPSFNGRMTMGCKASLAVLVLGCAVGFFANETRAAAALPDFGAATFVPSAPIDHPYFSLLDNNTRVFMSDSGDERFELKTVGAGPTILGVQTLARRDRAFEEGLLVEDTFDYYAQDTAGNVWYFGEDVTNYLYDADDNLIGTNNESAWRAGVNGALPGFIMPADLTVGFNYYQEHAPSDDALDQGTTFAILGSVTTDMGTFSDVLQVFETSELDVTAREFKYYAPGGVGLILVEEGLDVSLMNPETTLQLVAVIPEPSIAALLICGLGLCVAGARRNLYGCSATPRACSQT
jgi:hypothetical protein